LVQADSTSAPCLPILQEWALVSGSLLAADDGGEEAVLGHSVVEDQGDVESRRAVELVDEAVRVDVETRGEPEELGVVVHFAEEGLVRGQVASARNHPPEEVQVVVFGVLVEVVAEVLGEGLGGIVARGQHRG
jgi:hypothetical protein